MTSKTRLTSLLIASALSLGVATVAFAEDVITKPGTPHGMPDSTAPAMTNGMDKAPADMATPSSARHGMPDSSVTGSTMPKTDKMMTEEEKMKMEKEKMTKDGMTDSDKMMKPDTNKMP